MLEVETRKKRGRLYTLLAAMHSGSLGVELVPSVKALAEEVLALQNFPETLPPPPAELHRWGYGFCSGNAELGCAAGSPKNCLPAKLNYLATSAKKGAAKRRSNEADYIQNELIPCLETNIEHMEIEAYRDLIKLTKAIVEADAERYST